MDWSTLEIAVCWFDRLTGLPKMVGELRFLDTDDASGRCFAYIGIGEFQGIIVPLSQFEREFCIMGVI